MDYIEEILSKTIYTYEYHQHSTPPSFTITIDEEADIVIEGFILNTPEIHAIKFLTYIDFVNDDDQQNQMRIILSLNLEGFYGCYGIDEEANIIFYAASIPYNHFSSESLEQIINFSLLAIDLYGEYYLEREDGFLEEGN